METKFKMTQCYATPHLSGLAMWWEYSLLNDMAVAECFRHSAPKIARLQVGASLQSDCDGYSIVTSTRCSPSSAGVITPEDGMTNVSRVKFDLPYIDMGNTAINDTFHSCNNLSIDRQYMSLLAIICSKNSNNVNLSC